MPRLDQLAVDDLFGFSAAFRSIGETASCLEVAAQGIAEHLRSELVDEYGEAACPLVRVYKTHRYGQLPDELRLFADGLGSDQELNDETRCLTLLGSAGAKPAWNDPRQSAGHRAIPLVSEAAVARSPMIASLIQQMGLEVGKVIAPDPRETIRLHHRDYDLFFVPDARKSPMVPAQADFVEPHGIRSVIGCGGMLPSADLLAVIVFSRLDVPAKCADLFRTMATSVKAAVVPFTFNVFA